MWSVTPLLNIFMIHIYTLNLNQFIATETEPPIKFQILPPSVCILDTLLTLYIYHPCLSSLCSRFQFKPTKLLENVYSKRL